MSDKISKLIQEWTKEDEAKDAQIESLKIEVNQLKASALNKMVIDLEKTIESLEEEKSIWMRRAISAEAELEGRGE